MKIKAHHICNSYLVDKNSAFEVIENNGYIWALLKIVLVAYHNFQAAL